MAENNTTADGGKHNTVTVTDANFDDVVINSKLPVVVDFWAKWCSPCLAIAPSLEALAVEFEGKLVIAKLDVEQNSGTVARFQVQGFPTLLFFHEGEVKNRTVGAEPRARLRANFEAFLVTTGAEQSLTAEQTAALDAVIAAAEARREQADQESLAEFKRNVPEFEQFEAIRMEFLSAIAAELPPEKRAIAERGAAGEFNAEIYEVFAEVRDMMYEQERFAELVKREKAVIEAVNTPENRKHSEAHIARAQVASDEFDETVEAARKRILG